MEENTDHTLTPHPEDAALREELARLCASLTALLLQRDELLLIQCRRIEAAYLRRFGALELKVYECWCDCLRAKRKAKLIRARQNRREQADLTQIEAELDGELAVYREKLEERVQRIAGLGQKQGGPGLSVGGARELRELYRQAVKALHPDLHPGEDERRVRTLEQAMRAYRAGDLDTLRAICDAVEPAKERTLTGLAALRTEVQRLRASLRELNNSIEKIKQEYPYNARVYLEDEASALARRQELSNQLRDLKMRTARYETAIARMLDDEEENGERV